MSTTVRQQKTKRVLNFDVDKYVNVETGEVLSSELKNIRPSVTVTEKGDYMIMSSDDFIILDSKTAEYLAEELSRAEFANMLKMATDLKTPLNLVYNGPRPHTNETLQNFLGYASESMFSKLIKKLMKVGVLYQIKGNIMGEVRVIYMLNPFIARKRKTVDTKLFEVFKPFIK